jgi:hypothetical protein
VCLSLLGTWSGPGWVPGTSTLSQVLLSIQGGWLYVCALQWCKATKASASWHRIPGRTSIPPSLVPACLAAAGQILVDTPYANEPGFERVLGTDEGRRAVGKHNALLRLAVRRADCEP